MRTADDTTRRRNAYRSAARDSLDRSSLEDPSRRVVEVIARWGPQVVRSVHLEPGQSFRLGVRATHDGNRIWTLVALVVGAWWVGIAITTHAYPIGVFGLGVTFCVALTVLGFAGQLRRVARASPIFPVDRPTPHALVIWSHGVPYVSLAHDMVFEIEESTGPFEIDERTKGERIELTADRSVRVWIGSVVVTMRDVPAARRPRASTADVLRHRVSIAGVTCVAILHVASIVTMLVAPAPSHRGTNEHDAASTADMRHGIVNARVARARWLFREPDDTSVPNAPGAPVTSSAGVSGAARSADSSATTNARTPRAWTIAAPSAPPRSAVTPAPVTQATPSDCSSRSALEGRGFATWDFESGPTGCGAFEVRSRDAHTRSRHWRAALDRSRPLPSPTRHAFERWASRIPSDADSCVAPSTTPHGSRDAVVVSMTLDGRGVVRSVSAADSPHSQRSVALCLACHAARWPLPTVSSRTHSVVVRFVEREPHRGGR